MTNIRDWAGWFVGCGLRVLVVHGIVIDGYGSFACTCGDRACDGKRRGKHPVAPNGVDSATNDIAEIERWFVHPSMNLAIATGPNFTIVDVDGERGHASLAQLRNQLGDALNTPWVHRTHSGGLHLAFRAPPGVGNRVGILDGIDVRGERGYVVAPGSLGYSGRRYEFEGTPSMDLPMLPDLFRRPSRVMVSGNGDRIREGTRNVALTSVAGSLRKHGVNVQVMTDALRALNGLVLEAPLPDGEIVGIATSIAKHEPEPDVEHAFVTGSELFDQNAESTSWIVPGYVSPGAITAIQGAPKVGKSTFTVGMVLAMLGVAPFLGMRIERTSVVFMTEQKAHTLADMHQRFGLKHDELHWLLRDKVRKASWPGSVAGAIARARRVGARVIVVDTLPGWSLGTDTDENAAASALAALEPLHEAADLGIAVIALWHPRKSHGDVVDAGRGSSAFAAEVDLIVNMDRYGSRPTLRVLDARSRFSDTPHRLVVELLGTAFVDHGDGRNIEDHALADAIVALFPHAEGDAMTIAVVEAQLRGTPHQAGRTRLTSKLNALVQRGVIRRVEGHGKTPQRFWSPDGAA